MEIMKGAYYPIGGMVSIAVAGKLGADIGVQFHYATPVQEIIIENKKPLAYEPIKGRTTRCGHQQYGCIQ